MIKLFSQPGFASQCNRMRIRIKINIAVHANSRLKLVSKGFQLFSLHSIRDKIAQKQVLLGAGKVKMG